MEIAELKNVCKTYPAFRLCDVSFSLERGRITGFIGRNGAGKTTTIKSMLNLIHTDSGEISYFGLPLQGHETEIKQRIGYSTGTVSWYPRKAIREIIEITRSFYPGWDEEACRRYMTLFGLEDAQAAQLSGLSARYTISVEPLRNQYDYIYQRKGLMELRGRHLAGKRNHIRRFRAEHPDFEYRPLRPELFDDCRRLTEIWVGERDASDTIDAEKQVMETIFSHWDELGMTGGSIFTDGRMVAFTYGAAVTDDTMDVCVEKADRRVEGAFAIINQQFAEHLPEQYVYVNREEDMGIAGLRLAKLSYQPEILLTFNAVHITENDRR